MFIFLLEIRTEAYAISVLISLKLRSAGQRPVSALQPNINQPDGDENSSVYTSAGEFFRDVDLPDSNNIHVLCGLLL